MFKVDLGLLWRLAVFQQVEGTLYRNSLRCCSLQSFEERGRVLEAENGQQ